ncbi:hypothetical protein V8G54_036393, partial [Vigna mungo]
PLDPLLLLYNVVPQNLPFSDLLLLPRRARLPTLLAAKTIFVTDNSPANFSLDHTPLIHPDLFPTPSLAVHSVQSFLDYSLFGDGLPLSSSLPAGNSIDSLWNSGASSSDSRLNGLFYSPSSPLFFHCYYVNVFQSLLKGKGKNIPLGCRFTSLRQQWWRPSTEMGIGNRVAFNGDGHRK